MSLYIPRNCGNLSVFGELNISRLPTKPIASSWRTIDMKSRRSLLAAAVPLLVGGCTRDPAPTDQSSTPTSDTTQRSPSPTDNPETQHRSPSPTSKPDTRTSTPDCMRGYTVYISRFAPTEQIVTGFRPAQQPLADRIITEDGVTLRTYGQPPIRTEQHTRYDEAYYRIDYEQTGTEEVQAERGDLSWESGQEAPGGKPVVSYTDLPEVDQHGLDYLIHGPKYAREGHPTQSLGKRDTPVPYPQGTADSELVGAGTMWVEWDDRVYKVTISTDDRTIARRTFDYTATRVADSKKGFRKYVADRYLKPLEGLSSEEKSVLEAAIEAGEEGKYEDCNEPSPGYEKLEQRMENMSELPAPYTGHWYISYEGEQYFLEIGGWVV